MKISLLMLLILTGGLSACSPFSKPDSIADLIFFDINGSDTQAVIKPELKNNKLKLAKMEIFNWPLSIKPCESCLMKTAKRFHPDGPSTWIELKDLASKSTLWVIETFQFRIFTQDWKLEFKPESIQFTNNNNKTLRNVDYSKELPLQISEQPDCTLLWFKRAPLEQPPEYIADDVADFKTQAIWQCRS